MAAQTQAGQILEIAKDVLSTTPGKEQHISDIADKAIMLNKNLGLSKDALVEKLSSVLNANLKSKTPIVLKVKNKNGGMRRGFFKLKRGVAGPTIKINKIKVPSVSTTFAGTAGEYAVASQLLFWGFNVSKPFVDNGIDLLAEKNGNTKFIQVKTCSIKEDENTFNFKIEQQVFDSVSHKAPWYIFVMRSGNTIHFAMIPNGQLKIWREMAYIKGKDFSIVIERDEKQSQYRLAGQDINPYIDDFSKLEALF